jgi:hypothetical protein
MKLQILGIRCAKCRALTQATERAAHSLGPIANLKQPLRAMQSIISRSCTCVVLNDSTVGFYPIAKPPPPSQNCLWPPCKSRSNRFLQHAPPKTPTGKKP